MSNDAEAVELELTIGDLHIALLVVGAHHPVREAPHEQLRVFRLEQLLREVLVEAGVVALHEDLVEHGQEVVYRAHQRRHRLVQLVALLLARRKNERRVRVILHKHRFEQGANNREWGRRASTLMRSRVSMQTSTTW